MFSFDIGLAISIITSLAAALAWHRSNARNQYAREREYLHILKTLEQNRESILHLISACDDVEDRLSRLEVWLLRDAKKV
jgi:hypothetical protein